MGLRINTNVVSLAAQHRLQGTTKKLATSLQRLSSGLRINSGVDDVVGLSKSESLRGQIRGIAVAELNVSNATSLLGVAEGSLAQLTEIGQQLREAVVQAADNTISSTDRTNITNKVSDLSAEFSRLAGVASFDGVSLLDGTFAAKSFQVGPNVGNTVTFSITDSRATNVGLVAQFTATTLRRTATATTSLDITDPTNLTINGVTLSSSAFTSDGVSIADADESAISYVRAINSVSGQSGVQAQVLSNVASINLNGSIAAQATDLIVLNGITLSAAVVTSTTSTQVLSFVADINSKSTQTGVTAAWDASTSFLLLTAADGRNIDILNSNASSTGDILGLAGGTGASVSVAVVYRGTFRLFSDSTFSTGNGTTLLGALASGVGLDTTTTLSNLNVATSANASTGIFILDNVIRQLQSRRADIGSKTIRFDLANQELQTRDENLQQAESRIRDTDVAAETAKLTSAQILQQAGVTVLARSNALPQVALTLLQQ